MTQGQRQQRVHRGLALVDSVHELGEGLFEVHGWMTDGETCSCPDHQFSRAKGTGATCKHMVAAMVHEARRNRETERAA